MSYRCLPELGEGCWPRAPSAGKPSAASKTTATARTSFCKDSETESLTSAPSGMTSAPSTLDPGEGQLTLFPAVSRVRTSPQRVKVQDLPEVVVDSGLKCSESLARLNLLLSTRKTLRTCVPVASAPSSKDLPAWGLTFDGGCWELGQSVRPTKETDSGYLLPTPTAAHYDTTNNGQRGDDLVTAVVRREREMWPTPMARDYRSGKVSAETRKKNSRPLSDVVVERGAGGGGVAGGPLNPRWVEWLMMWPIGLTNSEPLAMAGYRLWRSSLIASLRAWAMGDD